jgi:hypothetical protein
MSIAAQTQLSIQMLISTTIKYSWNTSELEGNDAHSLGMVTRSHHWNSESSQILTLTLTHTRLQEYPQLNIWL